MTGHRDRVRSVVAVVRRAGIVAVLAALLLGLGNLGASSGEPPPQLDVVVAVDVTTSMSALDDPTGSRITAVRRDLAVLADELEGARISVVSFGRESRVLLPFSPDDAAATEVAEALQVEEATVGSGTSIGDAVPALRRQLASQPTAERSRVPVVVVMTDGENTRPGRQRSFAGIGDDVEAAVVLGYGTEAGGVMPVQRVDVEETPPAPAAAGPLVTDRTTGAAALSRRDPDNLEVIAEQLSGQYVACDGRQDIAQVAADLEDAARGEAEPGRPARELRWVWALLLLVLVLPELGAGWRRALEARQAVRP